MKPPAVELWCDRLQLLAATRGFLAHLRSSPPARRVQGRLFNVCGTFASRKMGLSIQFESHTVELWAIYTMEYDVQVLEFFDQPHQLELHYQGPSGRPTQALHTPDFLVLRTDGASFEEWKPEEKLLELMVTHPGRYQRDDSGKWRCPPGEAAAASLGWGPCAQYRSKKKNDKIEKVILGIERRYRHGIVWLALVLAVELFEDARIGPQAALWQELSGKPLVHLMTQGLLLSRQHLG